MFWIFYFSKIFFMTCRNSVRAINASVSMLMLKWNLFFKNSKEVFENAAFTTLKIWRTDCAKNLNRHDKRRPFLKPSPVPALGRIF